MLKLAVEYKISKQKIVTNAMVTRGTSDYFMFFIGQFRKNVNTFYIEKKIIL
jgi:hypothetical protein